MVDVAGAGLGEASLTAGGGEGVVSEPDGPLSGAVDLVLGCDGDKSPAPTATPAAKLPTSMAPMITALLSG